MMSFVEGMAMVKEAKREEKNTKQVVKVKYKFEWADVRALVTIANVVLIIIVGLGISWMGLGIAVYDLIQDIRKKSHINLILIHLSMLVLNSYFLMLFYNLL